MRKKIIYVDDVNYSLVSLKSRLGKYYDIFGAESSSALFETLDNIEPDLILLDINMPEVDGYKTIKKLKSDERYAHIPVIFLTGESKKDSVVKGLSLGAADYVVKPYSGEKLIEVIESVLRAEINRQLSVKVDSKPNILVVDDVASILRAVDFALNDKYKVHALSDSEEVLDYLKSNNIDLILLDYMMPILNGFELIPFIKALPEYEDTPVIILTTEGTPEHVSEAISRGASDFIVKPFNPKELNEKVAKNIKIAEDLWKVKKEEEKLIKSVYRR